MSEDLLIKINADAANAKKAFDDIREKTSDLEDGLKKAAIVSAVAFAAFTAEIYESVKAYSRAREATDDLNLALQNQGIFSQQLVDKYADYAKAVSEKTGVDDAQITKAQGVAQTYLKQTEVTKDLTQGIVDLAQLMGGDLNAAAEKIGKTIGSNHNAFIREGLVISDTATSAERYSAVMQFLNQHVTGLAEAHDKANGYTVTFATSIEHLQKAIGEYFFPAVAALRKGLSDLFNTIAESPALTALATGFIAAGFAIAGIVLIASAGIPVFLAFSAAAAVLGTSLSVALLGIPVAIGLLVAGILFLYKNWDYVFAFMASVTKNVVTLVSESFAGLSKIIDGFIHGFDGKKMSQGFEQLRNASKTAQAAGVQTYKELTAAAVKADQEQNASKKKAADEVEAKEKAHQAVLVDIQKQSHALMKLQNEFADKDLIDLKAKELETLKAMENETNQTTLTLLRQRLAIIRQEEDQARDEDLEREHRFGADLAAVKKDLADQGISVDAELKQQKIAELRATAKTTEDIDRDIQETILKKKIDADNQKLLDTKKYGKAYAEINKAIHSDEVQGAKSAANDLVALQQSKNATLKTIGKAAAVTEITIDTAEAATRIFNGFATIPIIGPALGLAGAAAAIAFGAERIGQVVGAAEGGLITGGIPGRDSVPAMLMPGELVVPAKNFEQVVGAVRGDSGNGQVETVAALNRIEAKITAPQTTIIHGDVMADDSYIDAFVRKINDAVEFRNAKLSTG